MLVRIQRCGVCHSDLHMQDGYFALGDDKKLDVRAGRTLPFTLGHEIAGVIEARRSRRRRALRTNRHRLKSLERGSVAVYPWIGCGKCAACARGEENICAAPRHLGIQVDGGYATHVLVPHPRYLIDYAPLSRRARRRADVLGPDRLRGAQAACRRSAHATRARRCWSASAASA